MNKKNSWPLIILVKILFIGFQSSKKYTLNFNYERGQKIDSLNGVFVYFNGGTDNVTGRKLTKDGYNLGLKYQCVEFVKRYYFEHLNHKMPNSYGHAKDFYNLQLKDGDINKQRNLIQYKNPSISKPQINDLLIYSGTIFNKYGHVAIISNIYENEIEIIQQNPGLFGKSRERYSLENKNGNWIIENERIIGWLRKY